MDPGAVQSASSEAWTWPRWCAKRDIDGAAGTVARDSAWKWRSRKPSASVKVHRMREPAGVTVDPRPAGSRLLQLMGSLPSCATGTANSSNVRGLLSACPKENSSGQVHRSLGTERGAARVKKAGLGCPWGR